MNEWTVDRIADIEKHLKKIAKALETIAEVMVSEEVRRQERQ